MGRSFSRLLAGALLMLLAGCAATSMDAAAPLVAKQTGIRGRVIRDNGEPVAGAWVYVYRNTSTSLRGPADFAAQTDAGGNYFLDLVEGSYYLISRWRRSGGEAGPPQTGDAWALYERNPVVVRPDEVSHADFTLQGVKPGQPVLLRSGSFRQGRTGFTGRLLDAEGNPQVGAFALAYRDRDFRRMPDFTSGMVGADGRFELFVPNGGRYCLAARTRTRGQPVAGEPYGLLAEGDAGCRNAVDGEITDVGAIHLAPYRR